MINKVNVKMISASTICCCIKKIANSFSFPAFNILFLLIATTTNLKTQNLNDFKVVLHEETLNKVFTAIGEIKGSNDYEVLFIKGTYNWKVINPKISLQPDSSFFECSADIECGPFTYSAPVKGNVKIFYDEKKNEINVKIIRGLFEIYTMIMGKKVHIKTIDIADYLKDPFVFEGPKSLATDFEFTLPDSTKKHIYIQPSKCEMQVVWKEIITVCELDASDKPFKAVSPVKNKSNPKTESKLPDNKKTSSSSIK